MNMLNGIKKNKLYISIILIIVIIITFGFLYTRKTEAPIHKEEFIVKEKSEETKPQNVIPNNTSTIAQKYKIVNRNIIRPEDTKNKSKVILLTIDDGPSGRTKEMIDILKKHNAKAIFFINGMHDKGYPGIIKYTSEEGFAVGNHTWSHLNLKKEKDLKISEKEINTNTELITKETGIRPRFFRAPYGESNTTVRQIIKDDGMIFMDWSGAAKDWEKSTKDQKIFVDNVMKDLHNGSIILIHEHPWSIANMDALLTEIESKGYTYVDPKDIIE